MGKASDARRAREASARRVRKRLGSPGLKRASEATIKRVERSSGRGGSKRVTTVVTGAPASAPERLGETTVTETLPTGQTVQVTAEAGVKQREIERGVTQLREQAGRSYRQVLSKSAYEQQQKELQARSLTEEISKQYVAQTPFKKSQYDIIQERSSPYFSEEKTKRQKFYEEKIKPRIKEVGKKLTGSRPFQYISQAYKTTVAEDIRIGELKATTPQGRALGFVSRKIAEPVLIPIATAFAKSPFSKEGIDIIRAQTVQKAIQGKQKPSKYITAQAIDYPITEERARATAEQSATEFVQYFTKRPLRAFTIGAVETALILGTKGASKYITRTPASYRKSVGLAVGGTVAVGGAGALGYTYLKDVAERLEGATYEEQAVIRAQTASELVSLGYVPARSKQLARTVEELGMTQRRGRKPATAVERQIEKQQAKIYEEASEFGKLELRGLSDTQRINVEQSLPVRSPTDRAVAKQFQKFAEEKDLAFFGSITAGPGADVEVTLQRQTAIPGRIKRTLGIETPTTLAFEFSERLTKISPKLQPEITQLPTGQVDLSIGEFKATFTQPRYLETTASAYVGGFNVLRTTPGVGELTLPLRQRMPVQSQRFLSQQYLSKYQGVLRGRAKDLPGLLQTRSIVLRELAGAGLPKSKVYKERYERLLAKPPVFELPQAKSAVAQFGEAIEETTPLAGKIEKRQRKKYSRLLARAEPTLLKTEAYVRELPTKFKELKEISPLSKLETTITYEPVAERAMFLESKGEIPTIRPYLTKEKTGVLLPFVSTGVSIEQATDRPTLRSARVKDIAVRPQPRPTPKRPYARFKRTPSPLYGLAIAGANVTATPAYKPSTRRRGYGAPAGGYTLPVRGYTPPSGGYTPPSRYTPPKGGYTPAKPYRVPTRGYAPFTGYALTRGGYTPADYTKTPGGALGLPLFKLNKVTSAPFSFKAPKTRRGYLPTLRATVGRIKAPRKGAKTKRLTGLEERPLLF
jgi:hypothetical protein